MPKRSRRHFMRYVQHVSEIGCQMDTTVVHVFTGEFGSHEKACQYTQEFGHEEPPPFSPPEVVEAWRAKCEEWPLSRDLGGWINEDFVETIEREGFEQYLKTMIPEDVVDALIAPRVTANVDTIVLIFDEAVADSDLKMKSTAQLTYLGEFECEL